MSTPKISVYLPSHNYGKFLSEAIESVISQTFDDWELIIIDDNSTDNTAEVMKLYEGYPNISLHHTDGIGLPSVCNYALKHARGKYVIRLDGDDVFNENILLVLSNYLDKDPDIALVHPDYYLVDIYGEVYSHERRRRYSGNHKLDLPPNGACTMVRKAIIEKVGGYREDLGAQDGYDLWTKLGADYKSTHVNVPLFYYRRHRENLTGNVKRIISARQQIKKDVIKSQLEGLRPLIAVIPCRKHFDFIEDLWRQEIDGHTLLERDIDVCLSSPLFDHVVVACDNLEVKETINNKNDPRLHFVPRETKSTVRSESIAPTLEDVTRKFDPEFKGITVMRFIQTPFVTADTLEEALTTLLITEAHSAVAVEEIHSPLYQRTPHGLDLINRRGEMASDFDTVYREAKTCQAIRNSNLLNGSYTGPSIASFVVSSAECFFIDSEDDLKLARLIAEDVS